MGRAYLANVVPCMNALQYQEADSSQPNESYLGIQRITSVFQGY